MKKFLFFAAVATMFASCTNENIDYLLDEQSEPVVFNTPVMYMNSRAAITDATYPTNVPFKVYATRTTSDGYKSGWDNNFMNGVAVTYHSEGTKWTPENAYYWPKNGDVISFAAVSPSEATGVVTYGTDGLTVTAHVVNTTVAAQQDLMYAPRVYNKKKEGSAVALAFKHALSLLSFKVTTESSAKIKIKEIKITGLKNKGTFKEAITDGKTNEAGGGAEYKSVPAWSTQEQASTFTVFTGEQEVTGTAKAVTGASTLVIPQTIETTPTLTVSWSYENGGESGNVQNDSKTINFNDVVATYEIGKKYDVTITINLDEITFTPSVTGWETGSVTEDPTM